MPSANHKICNAHKRDGMPCGMWACRGKTKCKMHGGKSLSGAAHPNYQGKGYSKSLPARHTQMYMEAEKDPRLFSMRQDAAACRARLHELFERLDTGESGAVWQQLGAAHAAFAAAVAGGNMGAMRQQLETMKQLIVRGQGDYAAWEDVRATWDSLTKLTTTEYKTLVAMQQIMTFEQVALYFGVIAQSCTDIVTAHIDGPQRQVVLEALAARFEHLAQLDTAKAG